MNHLAPSSSRHQEEPAFPAAPAWTRKASPLSADAAPYLEDLYARYRANPHSVDASWQAVFQLAGELRGGAAANDFDADILAKVTEVVRARGHLAAMLDPLSPASDHAWEALIADAGLVVRADAGLVSAQIDSLRRCYAGTLAVETAHLNDAALRDWLVAAVEAAHPLEPRVLVDAQRRLIEAEEFERFLGKRFPGKKRFGAEGAEVLPVVLRRVLEEAARAGVEQVVIGGMHRGRISVMANVLGKPLARILAEFKGAHPFADPRTTAADVTYHLGFDTTLTIAGRRLEVRFLPNPSHLEAIDPVAAGCARAFQDLASRDGIGNADSARKVLCIVLHTDASVIAQGVVAETLQLSGVPGFRVGGTLHIIVNNQLGFTTEPQAGRTSCYCTGQWKAIDSAILHVNGDDPEAALRAADIALAFRQTHARDAVIDIVCYRRNGHNEIDEPRFTQPLLYRKIDQHRGVRETYARRLIEHGIWTEADELQQAESTRARFEASYAAADTWRPAETGYPGGRWDAAAALADDRSAFAEPDSGVAESRLRELLSTLSTVPTGLTVEPKLQRLVRERADVARGIPWAVGESLAFASLLTEGVPIRLTGQDVVRGAFSHRHLALTDTQSGTRHLTLDHLDPSQARFSAFDSPLSEYATLGFEYGYSTVRAESLTIWEAQFGDFANVAQVIIDQFIVGAEDKWRQPSGLVLLLPHGLEGQGPEHSSARIERWLQLAARDCFRVAHPSTPANYFHLLRGQMQRAVRTPLVVFAPKTLLRLPAAVSQPADFLPGTGFRKVIISGTRNLARRILLCNGKIAYELERERERRGARDVLIVRLEQLYPLPADELRGIFANCRRAELVWVQEEPENMGAWSWLDRRLEAVACAGGRRVPHVRYCGRPEASSPAGSFHGHHEADQAAIIARAFDPSPEPTP